MVAGVTQPAAPSAPLAPAATSREVSRPAGQRVAGHPHRRPATPGRAAPLPPAERRAAILLAAAPLFRRLGHDVTTRQIADAAGIAEGTVFRVFPTKQSIVEAVLTRAFDLTETLAQIKAIDPTHSLEDRVRACAVILSTRLSAVIDLMIALRMHGAGHAGGGASPAHGGPRPTGRDPRQDSEVLTAIAGVIGPDAERLNCTAQRAAHLLRLFTFAGTHRLVNDDDPLSPDEITDVLLHGIARAPSGSGRLPPAPRH